MIYGFGGHGSCTLGNHTAFFPFPRPSQIADFKLFFDCFSISKLTQWTPFCCWSLKVQPEDDEIPLQRGDQFSKKV